MIARNLNRSSVQETAPAVLEPILCAHEEGQSALLLTGRSLYDLVVDEGKLRPLVESLRLICRRRYGMAFVRYSLAGGLDWDKEGLTDNRNRQTVENALRVHGLLNLPQDQSETVRIIRGVSQLSRAATDGLKWADGSPLRFAFLLEFSEHLTPALANGTQTNEQLIAIELAHTNAQSLALRQSGNLVLFHSRSDGLVDELVSGALRPIRLAQPDATEKKVFLDAATRVYPKASFQAPLSGEEVVRLTARTPNRSLETLLRSSHRTGRKLSVSELIERKSHDVEEISEQTLTVLDTSRVERLDLRGTNMEVPRYVLDSFAEKPRQGNPNVPAQLLLVGSPGTGKTNLAILTASQAQVAAYRMNSPKGGIVGETERKCRLQYLALKEWTPNVAFVDEITEAMPLERSDFDGDSGASRAVTAAMLSALSDESGRGRSLLLATANCP